MKSLSKQSKNFLVNPGFSCEKYGCFDARNMRLNLYDKTNKQKTDLYRALFSQNMPKQYFTNQECPQSEGHIGIDPYGRSTAESEPSMIRKLGVSAW